jgi:putative toxin-antitoxin system antitoxin component (TIGR02293 family)
MEWQETAKALGGNAILGKDVVSGATFARKVEQGLPRVAIARLKQFTQLSDAELSEVIPRRTLTSLRGAKKLSAEQSDRVARTAGIAALAQRVFGNVKLARDWLRTPNAALTTKRLFAFANRQRSESCRGRTNQDRPRSL